MKRLPADLVNPVTGMTISHTRVKANDVRVVTRNPDGSIHEKAVIGIEDASRLAAQDRKHGFRAMSYVERAELRARIAGRQAGTLAGALDNALEQIRQMEGMFSDSDGAIAGAVREGEEALDAYNENSSVAENPVADICAEPVTKAGAAV